MLKDKICIGNFDFKKLYQNKIKTKNFKKFL